MKLIYPRGEDEPITAKCSAETQTVTFAEMFSQTAEGTQEQEVKDGE